MGAPGSGHIYDPPVVGWEGPMHADKQFILTVLFLQGCLLAAISFTWMFVGQQNNPQAYFRTNPTDFAQRVSAMTNKFQVAPRTVRVPPGQDVFLASRMWEFYPDLILKKDQTYTIWITSLDVLHGPIIGTQVLSFMVSPGHTQGLVLTPNTAGKFLLYCGEYCGVGHQTMMGKIVVEE